MFDASQLTAPESIADNGKVAIVEVGGQTWHHPKLNAKANQLSRALFAAGLAPRDSIAILSPNCCEYLAIYLAAIRAGLYCVPISWRLSSSEIIGIVRDSDAKALFVHSRLGAVLLRDIHENLPRLHIRVEIGPRSNSDCLSFDQFIRGFDETELECSLEGRLLGFTSATTGVAKGVRRPILAKSNAPSGSRKFRARDKHGFDLPEGGIHLCCSQFYHAPVLGLTGSELAEGNTIVVPEKWDPEEALALIEKYRVTTMFLVPAMFVRLLKLPAKIRGSHDLSSLRFVLHSGAPCPVPVKRAMIEWWGPILWERYGSVEGPVTLVRSDEWLRYPGTVGKPDRGIDVKVLDDLGAELPVGQIGAVYVRSRPEFAFEYGGDAQKTKAARCGDYYTVGDIGYLNEEGYLFLCDRQLDVIISGGVNIYGSEIEWVLIQHKDVADCAVIGVPHDFLGEVPRAIVQLAAGVSPSPSLAWDLIEFARRQIATHKLPHRVDFVDSLPRDPNGKLYKRKLRESLVDPRPAQDCNAGHTSRGEFRQGRWLADDVR